MADVSELIDWEQLDGMAFGYTPDFVEIYHEFLAQTPPLFDLLDEACRDGQAQKAAEIAHKMKGSALNFGFKGLSDPLVELESEAKSGSLSRAADRVLLARKNFEDARLLVEAQRGV